LIWTKQFAYDSVSGVHVRRLVIAYRQEGLMEQATTSSFFLGHLIQGAHLTEADGSADKLFVLLTYRTRMRQHHGQDLEVSLMALAAARQIGHSVDQLSNWIRRLCERVLLNPDAIAEVGAIFEETPMTGNETELLDWFRQTLARVQGFSRC